MGTKKTKTDKPKAATATRETLSKRYMVRMTDNDQITFDVHARGKGFNGAGAWLRQLGLDAIKALPPAERKALEAQIAELA